MAALMLNTTVTSVHAEPIGVGIAGSGAGELMAEGVLAVEMAGTHLKRDSS
jgi:pyruvate/2-oxoglutarate dehydrogenase complex dihydrolipoamide dehydrogenase (E3) component